MPTKKSFVCCCGGKFKTRNAFEDHVRKSKKRAELHHQESTHVFAYRTLNGTKYFDLPTGRATTLADESE